MMLQPFEKIVTTNIYNLKYYYNANRIDIVDCLQKTHDQYGDRVSEKDFTNMINILTKGVRSSVLFNRRNPEIIKKLCTLYPDFMNNTKIIANIIKCMSTYTYPQACITDITSTGYKFTESQIMILNKEGYTMFGVIETMSYNEFLSLFDNGTFLQNIIKDIAADYDTPAGRIVIDEKIKTLKETTNKFGINVDYKFIETFLSKCHCQFGVVGVVNHSHVVLNIHIIAKGVGLELLSKDDFIVLAEKYQNFYSPNYYDTTITNYHALVKFDNTRDARDKVVSNARKVLIYYDKPITRDVVLRLMTPDTFITFVTPDTSDYDPVEDIFFILSSLHDKHKINDARYIVIKHFIDNGYLIYDKFLMLLISLGLTDCDQRYSEKETIMPLLTELMHVSNITPSYQEIDNIFTFCHFSTINALSDIKIIPTKDLLSLNLYKNVIDNVVNKSVFIEDDTVEFSEFLSSYVATNHVNITSDIVKVYESLNDRDKQIFIRIPHDGSVSNIIRYRLPLTKEYVVSILRSTNWRSIVFLLHLSKEYRYIIDFIDENVIMLIPEIVGRLWFHNNVMIRERQPFALPNKFYNLQPNIEKDVADLLSKPIIHDITEIIKNIKRDREATRFALISNGSSIKRTTSKNVPLPTTSSLADKAIKDGYVYDYDEAVSVSGSVDEFGNIHVH